MYKYTVLAGDTHYDVEAGLSCAAGVSVQYMEAAKPGVNTNALHIGTLLNIPARLGQTIALKCTIQDGDSNSIIAAHLAGCTGLRFQEIEQANPSANPNSMPVGQALIIQRSSAEPITPVRSVTTKFKRIARSLGDCWYWTWSDIIQVPENTDLSVGL